MKNMTIGKRIAIGFLLVISICAALGIYAYGKLQTIGVLSGEIEAKNVPSLYAVGEIKTLVRANLSAVYKHLGSISTNDMAQIESQMKSSSDIITKFYSILDTNITSTEARDLFKKTAEARSAYTKLRADVLAMSRQSTNNQSSYDFARKNLDPACDAYIETLEKLSLENKESADKAADGILAAVTNSVKGIFIGVLLSILTGTIISWKITRSAADVLKRVASTLNDGANNVASAAGHVSGNSQSLAEGASEQAASLQETSASLEEVSSMTKRNNEGAQKAKELASQTKCAAENGAGHMKSMNASVETIHASSEEMRKAMDAVKSSNNEISKIIKTIDEIAFQTNILALNAAVEAARAGEAGMGFAVVADEVRNLAQKSAQAARETAEKIEGAIQRTETGARVSEKVVEDLKAVLDQSAHVGSSLQTIVGKAREVDQLVGEIAVASNEQTHGIEQVNIAMSQMDKVTQSNAATAEESAGAAEELNSQAILLKDAVEELLSLVDGGGHAAKQTFESAGQHSPSKGAPAREKTQPAPLKMDLQNAESAQKRIGNAMMDGDFKDF